MGAERQCERKGLHGEDATTPGRGAGAPHRRPPGARFSAGWGSGPPGGTGRSGLCFPALALPQRALRTARRFKVGPPDQFGEGARFFEEKRVFVLRERNTFHAISAVCTHLGCTVKMERLNQLKKSAGGRQGIRGTVRIPLPMPRIEVLRRRHQLLRAGAEATGAFQTGSVPGRRPAGGGQSQIADQDFRLDGLTSQG